MEAKYVELFKELTRATAVAAEQVMEYDNQQNDKDGFEKARMMRDDFENLHSKLSDNFDGTLTKAEYAKLLVGAYVITNNLKDKITVLKRSIKAYEEELIPRLNEIVDTENEEDVQKVADKVLALEDNK